MEGLGPPPWGGFGRWWGWGWGSVGVVTLGDKGGGERGEGSMEEIIPESALTKTATLAQWGAAWNGKSSLRVP